MKPINRLGDVIEQYPGENVIEVINPNSESYNVNIDNNKVTTDMLFSYYIMPKYDFSIQDYIESGKTFTI